jgi:predicted Zn-dependent protease
MSRDGDNPFYTVTMARLHARQGRYADAVRIYRHLLERAPQRSDLQAALEAAVSRMGETAVSWHEHSRLIERWVRLLLRQNAVRHMRNLNDSR